MELKNLSQNWRKLQETFKQSKSSAALKRKAPDKDSSLLETHIKRRKATPATRFPAKKPHISRRRLKMSDTESHPSSSVAYSAEVEPLEDLPTANLPTTSRPAVTEGSSRVNEGLSPTANEDIGKYVAIDCEMVGVGPNPRDKSMLARVSIVNYHGEQIYDSFVLPKERVTDWRTPVSGITEALMEDARSFEEVYTEVSRILDGRILVGHALWKDLKMLMIGHPKRDIRDTSRHPPFRQLNGGNPPSLKLLASEFLGVEIQGGAHSSVEDARACMLLYRRDKDAFECEHAKNWPIQLPVATDDNAEAETNGREEGKGPTRRKKKNKKKKNTR